MSDLVPITFLIYLRLLLLQLGIINIKKKIFLSFSPIVKKDLCLLNCL